MAETWIKPVAGGLITARFGQSGPYWTNKHTGLDYATFPGAPIVAVASGTVIFAGWDGDAYGNMVKLSHGGGVETWYAHMLVAPTVSGSVSQGDRIGLVGATGNVTGPHVHLEVRVNGTPRNPEQFVGSEGPATTGGAAVGQVIETDLSGGVSRIGMFAGGAVLIGLGVYLFISNKGSL